MHVTPWGSCWIPGSPSEMERSTAGCEYKTTANQIHHNNWNHSSEAMNPKWIGAVLLEHRTLVADWLSCVSLRQSWRIFTVRGNTSQNKSAFYFYQCDSLDFYTSMWKIGHIFAMSNQQSMWCLIINCLFGVNADFFQIHYCIFGSCWT